MHTYHSSFTVEFSRFMYKMYPIVAAAAADIEGQNTVKGRMKGKKKRKRKRNRGKKGIIKRVYNTQRKSSKVARWDHGRIFTFFFRIRHVIIR